MKAFLLAAGTVYAALSGVALGWSWGDLERTPARAFVVVSVAAVPWLATWLVLEGVEAARPRRLFDRRLRLTRRRAALGAMTACSGVMAGTLLLVVVDRWLPDTLVMGAASAAATAFVATVVLRRRDHGRCYGCGYAFAGLTPASKGVCPECGVGLLCAAECPDVQ